MSFALGNKLLGVLDEKQHRERENEENHVGWYHKTDFEIHAVIGGEEFNYEGRFDIGDGEGDLTAHIRNFYEYSLSPDCPFIPEWKRQGEDYYRKKMESLRLGHDVFIPFLERNTGLTPEDEKQLAEIMSFENEWFVSAEKEKAPATDREIDILHDVLSQMKMDDIGLSYEDGVIVARSAGDKWQGAGFYHFLADEAMNFDGNGNLSGMELDADTLADFKQLAEHNGVEIPMSHSIRDGKKLPHYTVEQTSDAFADPFIIRNNEAPEDSADRYYDVGGIYQTFETEEEAQEYADTLNSAEHITELFAAKDAEREERQGLEPAQTGTDGMQDNSDLIGKELSIDNRRYLIESVGKISGDVSMRDITFQNNVGFPINRVEKVSYVRRLLEQEQKEIQPEEKADIPAKPTTETVAEYPAVENGLPYDIVVEKIRFDEPEQKPQSQNLADTLRTRLEKAKDSAGYTALKEDIDTLFMDKNGDSLVGIASDEWLKQLAAMPDDEFRKYADSYQKGTLNAYKLLPLSADRRNYRITDDALGVGGAKEKFRNNMSAIRLLHDLQIENRLATPEEQETLAKYVGWGGLSMAFDSNNAAWENEYKELKSALSNEEYHAAMESCCCSPGLSQTYSYMLSQTLFEKWVWKNQKYIFNRLTVLLCVFRLVVKAANGVYLALTTSLNTHTLWQRLTN